MDGAAVPRGKGEDAGAIQRSKKPSLAWPEDDRRGAHHAAEADNSLEVPPDSPHPSGPGDQPEPGPASPRGPQEGHRSHHGQGGTAGDLQDRQPCHNQVEEAYQ